MPLPVLVPYAWRFCNHTLLCRHVSFDIQYHSDIKTVDIHHLPAGALGVELAMKSQESEST